MKPADVVAIARHLAGNDRPPIEGASFGDDTLDDEITALAKLTLEQQVTLAKQEGQLRSLQAKLRDDGVDARATVLKLDQLRAELPLVDAKHTWSKARMFAQNIVDRVESAPAQPEVVDG